MGMVKTCDNYWTMHIDGSSTSISADVGIVIQSPNHSRFDYMNNQAEYEALIIDLGVLILDDSELVINQLNETFRCMSYTLAPYHMVASYLAKSFNDVTFKHISRVRNTDADELAQL
ncbi:uncharacterized protein [Malus domestica]|uniref:uncharacterized protein n=1 Tax=Malus domestica TaxID=3750 RepID=UPI000498DA7A